MAAQLRAPVLGGDGLTGEIIQWYRDDGAELAAGEPVFCYEAGFAAVDVEADEAGRLHRCFAPGTKARPGNVVALVLEPGEHVPDHEEDPMAAAPLPEPSARPNNVVDLPAPAEPTLLPLRRGAIRTAPAPAPGGAWDRAFGTSGHDYRGFWPLRDEEPHAVAPAEAKAPDAPAELEVGEPVQDEPAADDPIDAYAELDNFVPDFDPAPDLEPGSPLDFVPETALDALPEPALEPIAFPVFRAVIAEEGPEPEYASTPETWDDSDPVLFMPPAPVTLRGVVRLTELRKLCDQLGREWRESGAVPRNEDLVLRAVARAAGESAALAGEGAAAGLVTPAPGSDFIAVLEGAARGSLRERVLQLAAAGDAEQPPCAFTVVSFAEFGIDEAAPVIPDGHSFAFAMGATRPGGSMEDGVLAPIMTLTLAYSPDRISQGDAAALFARVRELIEAPYALLAD